MGANARLPLAAEQGRQKSRRRELKRGFIPGLAHISLDELRLSLSELPRDREIIAYCQNGQRSYNAARILSQHGFRVRNLTESYRTWRATEPH